MSPDPIYLDHNSTTPIDPRVVEAMVRAWTDCGANPASQHAFGRKARRTLEDAREGIAELLGAKTGGMDADQVIFTSGGTEANNLALMGLMPPIPGRINNAFADQYAEVVLEHPEFVSDLLVSAIEHPSVMGAAETLRQKGYTAIKRIAADGTGKVDEEFCALIGLIPSLVSVMLANNETGFVQPVAEIIEICRDWNVPVHTDAVQAIGKIPVHFRDLGVDAMTVAPHKFHGPLGIGALVVRHGIKLQPQLFGGFQQAALRPGTENVALAVGFHAALKLATDELPERRVRMQALRDQLEASLRAAIPEMVIVGEHTPRLPNTSCLAFPGLDRQALVMALDLAGVACSTGSACASGSSEPSPTLVAMGLPEEVIRSAIRFSLGATTTAAEVAEAARRILNTVNHLRSRK